MAAVPLPPGGPADAATAAVPAAATAPDGAVPPLPPSPAERARLTARLATHFDALRPTVHRPAAGILTAPWTTPGGYYNQLWDWDGFFIGVHLAHEGASEHLVHLVTKCVLFFEGGVRWGSARGSDTAVGEWRRGALCCGSHPGWENSCAAEKGPSH